jgi:signal transduction histidine kinase
MENVNVLETKFAPAERAENYIILQQAKYFESEKLLDPMLSAMPNSVVILNKQRQIVYANAQFLNMFDKTTQDEILGKRTGEVFNCIHASEMPGGCGTSLFCSVCGAANAILKAQGGIQSIQECRISTFEDGESGSLDLRVWATPYSYAGEEFTVFAVSDISDEKRRRILERIFFHDITNTAGTIQGLVELINSTDDLNTLKDFNLNTLLSQASNQLLDEIQGQQQIMSAESGDLSVQPEYLHTTHFLQHIINVYSNHSASEGKTIQLNNDLSNFMILTDRALLSRVMSNMVKNALEASQPGDVVTIGCQKIFEFVRFWVHNSKPIPQKVQLQIFQRSFTTKGIGRGLGTYSMKLLSENYLQGRVSFESDEKNGTTFMGMFPVELRYWESEVDYNS